MTRDTNRRKWRWLRHVAWVLAAKIFLIVVGLAIFFSSGLGNPLLQRYIVRRIASATGGTVELKGLSVRWLSARATLQGLTIHGREPAGTEPLFAVEEIRKYLDHLERTKYLAPREQDLEMDDLDDETDEEPWLENPVLGAEELLRFYRIRQLLQP